jgi:2-polyprenyl-3-methyl-5-hydroxy-6-metoxy-1,4-benzoquinol methylase
VAEGLDRLSEQLSNVASLALAAQPTTKGWPQNSGIACSEPSGAAKHIRFHRDMIGLAGLADLGGKKVLDVGSGFGLSLVTCGLLGAREVHGIEYEPDAVEAVARYLPELPPDLGRRIHNRQGDAAAIPYAAGDFDVVFSVEAISHYADVPAFLAEAARVLKAGGHLFISDGNNGTNPLVARQTRMIWRAFEEGQPGTQVGTHRVGASYRDMRRELVAKSYPHLSSDEVDLLARNTAGYTSAQVLQAADAYIATGEPPRHPYQNGDLAMSPQGMAMERLFHPDKLARDIERYGFRARAYGYWGGAAGKAYVRIANRVLMSLSRMTMPLAPAFRIVAQRV